MQRPSAKTGVIAALVTILVAAPFVAKQEAVVLQTYFDPIGIPTACVGETDRAITMRQRFSRDECMSVLGASLLQHAQQMDACIHRPLTQGQAVAILSWSYNVGVSAACGSSLIRKLNEGDPPEIWCAELSRWTRAGGRVLPGLVRRRAEERAMCEGHGAA